MLPNAERIIFRLFANAKSIMVKVAARWLSFPRSRWRSNLTKDESTFGTGQKTDLLIDPASSRDDHQLAYAVGAPYCLLFGAAAKR